MFLLTQKFVEGSESPTTRGRAPGTGTTRDGIQASGTPPGPVGARTPDLTSGGSGVGRVWSNLVDVPTSAPRRGARGRPRVRPESRRRGRRTRPPEEPTSVTEVGSDPPHPHGHQRSELPGTLGIGGRPRVQGVGRRGCGRRSGDRCFTDGQTQKNFSQEGRVRSPCVSRSGLSRVCTDV